MAVSRAQPSQMVLRIFLLLFATGTDRTPYMSVSGCKMIRIRPLRGRWKRFSKDLRVIEKIQ
ncbi:MAG: hypothetical protein C4293_07590 [Nitrospiraceae bacterium]